ncbi:hypothetical protein Daus18300_007190 [Diaporthe australafricana]|uniref:Uncharacterized protein n=1 Tax=Diaporthe australafricana TaxID=127596 RepID=A0ABR3WNR3_9PEZI
MELVRATQSKDQGAMPHGRWKTALLETLTASGTPLSDYWIQKSRVDDDLRIPKTKRITEAGFDSFVQRVDRWSRDPYEGSSEQSEEELDFTGMFVAGAAGRSFFVSSSGHFGLAAEGAQVGDTVCVFEGHKIPFLIRPVDEADHSRGWHLIGEAYHHDICPGRLILERGHGEPIMLV